MGNTIRRNLITGSGDEGIHVGSGADDNVIPAMETVLLAGFLHDRTTVHALLSGLITHAEVDRAAGAAFRLFDDHGTSDFQLSRHARELGLEIFVHDKNYGYGANQKTCYTEALRAGCDVVVMVHPDYQYSPLLVPAMAASLLVAFARERAVRSGQLCIQRAAIGGQVGEAAAGQLGEVIESPQVTPAR